jgi:hypothetical protein
VAYTDAGKAKHGPWLQPNGKYKVRVLIKEGGFRDPDTKEMVTSKEFIGSTPEQAMERARAWQDEYNKKFVRAAESLEAMRERGVERATTEQREAEEAGRIEPSEEEAAPMPIFGERQAPETPEAVTQRQLAEEHVFNYIRNRIVEQNMDDFMALKGILEAQGATADELLAGRADFERLKKFLKPVLKELIQHREIPPEKAYTIITDSINKAWDQVVADQGKLSAESATATEWAPLEKITNLAPFRGTGPMRDLIQNLEARVKNNRAEVEMKERAKEMEENIQQQRDGNCPVQIDLGFLAQMKLKS